MGNGKGLTVECTACGWQGSERDTDSRYCPDCGGECMELEAIYGPNGLSPDPEWDERESTPDSGSGQKKGAK